MIVPLAPPLTSHPSPDSGRSKAPVDYETFNSLPPDEKLTFAAPLMRQKLIDKVPAEYSDDYFERIMLFDVAMILRALESETELDRIVDQVGRIIFSQRGVHPGKIFPSPTTGDVLVTHTDPGQHIDTPAIVRVKPTAPPDTKQKEAQESEESENPVEPL